MNNELLAKTKIDIAIYGLSIETEKHLPELAKHFRIVGLLDSFRIDGEIFNYPIISIETAINLGVKLIIVIARPGSCKVITNKIGDQCKKFKISLYDIRGINLLEERRKVYNFYDLNSYTKNTLEKLTQEYDVISFDLFDTLIMRKVLSQTDMLELLSYRLCDKGVLIEDFIQKRVESEKVLTANTIPTLTEIYAYMIKKYGIKGICAELLADEEYLFDYSLIIPRNEMVDFVYRILNDGKKVFIITDTYYSKEQIQKILDKCGICGCSDIFVSCEYDTDKTRGLFNRFKSRVKYDRNLHIGDDIQADIESAKRYGIDAFKIYTATEYMDHQAIFDLYNKEYTIVERLKLGLFASKVFNSPFQFEYNGDIAISKSEDIGYTFFAPMIVDFVIWMKEQCLQNDITDILFGARDGYVIKKIFDKICSNVNTVYFYISRICAVRAGMETYDDIEYISEMKFSGNLSEQLRTRFGLIVDKIDENKDLFCYTDAILNNSKKYRYKYKKYIEKISLNGNRVAFFDFVAKGTCQFFAQRLLEMEMIGYYFLRHEDNRSNMLDVISFCSNENRNSVIYNEYYILEPILTSPEPSVIDFSEKGEVIFAEETRSVQEVQCCTRIQNGILEYADDYFTMCPDSKLKYSQNFDEIFLSLIHKYKIINNIFLNMNVEDPFFHRNTKISDLM